MLSKPVSRQQMYELDQYNNFTNEIKSLREKRDKAVQQAVDSYQQEKQENKKKRHDLKIKLFQDAVMNELRELRHSKCKRVMLIPPECMSIEDIKNRVPNISTFSLKNRIKKVECFIPYRVDDKLIAAIDFKDFPFCDTLDNDYNLQRFKSPWVTYDQPPRMSGIALSQNIIFHNIPHILGMYGKFNPKTINPDLDCEEHCLFVPTVKHIFRWIKNGIRNFDLWDFSKRPCCHNIDSNFPKGEWFIKVDLLAISSFDWND